MRLGDHCGQFLAKLAEEDQRIWVIDGDLADSDGAIHFAHKHPQRFIMGGIAEQSMVSMAAGMASCGLRPWVFSFASFLVFRAYDQIRVCLSQTKQPVTLVASHSGGLSNRNGKSHTALNDIALIGTLPNLQIWSPASPEDLFYACHQIMEENLPAYIRLPRRPLPSLDAPVRELAVLQPPQKINLISTGLTTQLALHTCQLLHKKGYSIGLIHCLRMVPFPHQELRDLLSSSEKIFVLEDHVEYGGLYSLVKYLDLPAKIISFGWPMNWCGQSGIDETILETYDLNPQQIASRIMNYL